MVTLTVPLEWQPLKRGVKKSILLQLNFEIMSSRKIILKYFGICQYVESLSIVDFVFKKTGIFLFLLFEHGQTLGAVPLALGLGHQTHAAEVEPLNRTIRIVATNHLAVRNLLENFINHFSRQLSQKAGPFTLRRKYSRLKQLSFLKHLQIIELNETKTCWHRQ